MDMPDVVRVPVTAFFPAEVVGLLFVMFTKSKAVIGGSAATLYLFVLVVYPCVAVHPLV